MQVYVIAGLGNPGREYKNTRHNAGWMAVDEISGITGIKVRGFKFKGRAGSGEFEGRKLFLLKPRTFMNLSGESVAACVRYFKLSPASLVVVHDDMDLPLGRIRVKRGGGDGGHKGIRSIVERLGATEFARVRIGIGKPDGGSDAADFVLTPFSKNELDSGLGAIQRAARAALAVVADGVDEAMNEFNSK